MKLNGVADGWQFSSAGFAWQTVWILKCKKLGMKADQER